MTETVALKTAVSRFLVESLKITGKTQPGPEMAKFSEQVKAIGKNNPQAVAEFAEAYPHLVVHYRAALAFQPAAPPQPVAPEE